MPTSPTLFAGIEQSPHAVPLSWLNLSSSPASPLQLNQVMIAAWCQLPTNTCAGPLLHLASPEVEENAGLLYSGLLRQVTAPAGVDEVPEVEEAATGEVEWGLETLVRVGENWIDKLDMVGCIWLCMALYSPVQTALLTCGLPDHDGAWDALSKLPHFEPQRCVLAARVPCVHQAVCAEPVL